MKSLFKKAAGVAVLIAPFLLSAGTAQAAEDKVPDDPRYAKLAADVKEPQKDCVLLDRIGETKNHRTKEVTRLIEIFSRVESNRQVLDQLTSNGFAFCIASKKKLTDESRMRELYGHKDASYQADNRVVVFDESASEGNKISAMSHEFAHGQDDLAVSFTEQLKQAKTFADKNIIVLDHEIHAFTRQIIDTWKIGRKEYTNGRSYTTARQSMTYESDILELNVQGRYEEGRALEDLNPYIPAFRMLDDMAKRNPEGINNGQAESEVKKYLQARGYIDETYTKAQLRELIHILTYNVSKLALNKPDTLNDRRGVASWLGKYMVEQGVMDDNDIAEAVAEKLFDATKNMAMEMGRTRPDLIAGGQASVIILENLENGSVLEELCTMIMDARKSEKDPRVPPANTEPDSKPMQIAYAIR